MRDSLKTFPEWLARHRGGTTPALKLAADWIDDKADWYSEVLRHRGVNPEFPRTPLGQALQRAERSYLAYVRRYVKKLAGGAL